MRRPRRGQHQRRTPCRRQSVGPWPGASHGLGTATEAKARVPAAQCGGTSHPQERSPQGRAGPSATILTGPLIMLGPAVFGAPPIIVINER